MFIACAIRIIIMDWIKKHTPNKQTNKMWFSVIESRILITITLVLVHIFPLIVTSQHSNAIRLTWLNRVIAKFDVYLTVLKEKSVQFALKEPYSIIFRYTKWSSWTDNAKKNTLIQMICGWKSLLIWSLCQWDTLCLNTSRKNLETITIFGRGLYLTTKEQALNKLHVGLCITSFFTLSLSAIFVSNEFASSSMNNNVIKTNMKSIDFANLKFCSELVLKNRVCVVTYA